MFLIIALVLIAIAYFSMPLYLLTSVVLYVGLQILGFGSGVKKSQYKQLRNSSLIAWIISIPFCLVLVYLQRLT